MRFFLALALLIFPSATMHVCAAAPIAGFTMWNAEQLKAAGDRLERRSPDKVMVYETFGNYKGHSVYLVLRRATGKAELHETESDVQISVRGKAQFVIGGELIAPEKLGRKQQHGTSIAGGSTYPLAPGDVIHVPVAVPHQIVVRSKSGYMYLLMKLDEEPLDGKGY